MGFFKALCVGILGIAQIVVGVSLCAIGGPLGMSFGTALVTEGISDMIFLATKIIKN